ncbi:hypothetical protein GCM10027203_56080 [Nonomuraea fastidiosa]
MAVSSPGKTTFRLSGHTPLGKTAFPLRRDAHVTNRTSEPDRRLTRLAGHTPPGRNAPPHRPHAASQGTFGSRDRASCPTAAKSAATELATRNGYKPHEAVHVQAGSLVQRHHQGDIDLGGEQETVRAPGPHGRGSSEPVHVPQYCNSRTTPKAHRQNLRMGQERCSEGPPEAPGEPSL